jgi:hypothetical protein
MPVTTLPLHFSLGRPTAEMGQENEPAFAGEVRVAVGAFSAATVNG